MPITNAFWNRSRGFDLHVLKGESSPDLSALHVGVAKEDGTLGTAREYLDDDANNDDITLLFTPLIKGVRAGDFFEGGGVKVNTTTGVVKVDDPLPSPHLRNFILLAEITNNADLKKYSLSIRIHIHGAVTDFWLTPQTLTVRPNGATRPDATRYMFTARARFDDGTLGDLTEDHNITWLPALLFDEPGEPLLQRGEVVLRAGHNPGDSIAITALLPVALGGAVATGTLKIAQPWGDPTTAAIVPGGGWPGTLDPAVVPNMLFVGDGFTNAQVDKDRFEQLTNAIISRFKTSKLTTPFDILSTSINFWRAFIPSGVRGISVACEMYTLVEAGETRAFPLPNAVKPPAAGFWTLEHVVFAVGLPVRADHSSNAARTNDKIRDDWRELFEPDLNPKITDDLLALWRLLGNRSFVDDKDTPLGLTYGKPPQVDSPSNNLLIDFNPRRLKRSRYEEEDQGRFDLFLGSLRRSNGIDLGGVWAERARVRAANYPYLFILSSAKASRPARFGGSYITMSFEQQAFIRGITLAATGALIWSPPAATAAISAAAAGSALHEMGHSFGLGDEYALSKLNFTGTAASLDRSGNLQAASDAKSNGEIHGDEIKWNWLRARKGALVREVGLLAADRLFVKVKPGHGLQFAMGDTLVLRKRNYPNPIGKDPDESSFLIVAERPTADRVVVDGSLPIGLDFGQGDVLYMPRVAPASVRSPIYPFAEMVAFNIKQLITSRKHSLSAEPCSFEQSIRNVQLPDVDAEDLPIKIVELPTVVGLYDGGAEAACGIFHPAGACMMNGGDRATSSFCAVCRYVLVETIDPFRHLEIDLAYDAVYPQR